MIKFKKIEEDLTIIRQGGDDIGFISMVNGVHFCSFDNTGFMSSRELIIVLDQLNWMNREEIKKRNEKRIKR